MKNKTIVMQFQAVIRGRGDAGEMDAHRTIRIPQNEWRPYQDEILNKRVNVKITWKRTEKEPSLNEMLETLR